MKALRFSETLGLHLADDHPRPAINNEATIAVRYAGICSTDLEIIKGYVPGYDSTLGHEFVGTVEACSNQPGLVGKRVVGEINCPSDTEFRSDDKVFLRNHYPRRTVLGIIARDGALAEYVSLPAKNLFVVPDEVTDEEAVFTEPLAAACRILEQQVFSPGDKVAIIGDGKLGLLVAQLTALYCESHSCPPPLHIGRHQEKLNLVTGSQHYLMKEDASLSDAHKQAFDVCVEATGSSKGILLALELTRPMGTIVQKSTCSAINDPQMPQWSNIATDVVVNEKRLVGSRCGPFAPALDALGRTEVKRLLSGMITATYPITEGVAAFEKARAKGSLKVLIDMSDAAKN